MTRFVALALALVPATAFGNYLGVLKAPQSSLDVGGFYSFSSAPEAFTALSPDGGYRLKLGYKYSRYFSVESEVTDFARPADPFANPANLAASFRGTGFGIDTVATLPVWRFSFYGRLGAYRGDRNGGFNGVAPTLLGGDAQRGARWRYGLGMRYDFSKAFGVRAELERHSSGLGTPLGGDADADQLTLGVSWRW